MEPRQTAATAVLDYLKEVPLAHVRTLDTMFKPTAPKPATKF